MPSPLVSSSSPSLLACGWMAGRLLSLCWEWVGWTIETILGSLTSQVVTVPLRSSHSYCLWICPQGLPADALLWIWFVCFLLKAVLPWSKRGVHPQKSWLLFWVLNKNCSLYDSRSLFTRVPLQCFHKPGNFKPQKHAVSQCWRSEVWVEPCFLFLWRTMLPSSFWGALSFFSIPLVCNCHHTAIFIVTLFFILIRVPVLLNKTFIYIMWTSFIYILYFMKCTYKLYFIYL